MVSRGDMLRVALRTRGKAVEAGSDTVSTGLQGESLGVNREFVDMAELDLLEKKQKGKRDKRGESSYLAKGWVTLNIDKLHPSMARK